DESDIGLIVEGQPVRFTVQAYPTRTFTGKVNQVRLQSVVQENVVNYTVVVDCSNSDGKLLPGMTATLDFLVGTATDVFRVPNAALRFRPTADQIAKLGGDSTATAAERSGKGTDSTRRTANDTTRRSPNDTARRSSGDSSRGRDAASAVGGAAVQGGGRPSGTLRAGSTAQLWYLDAQGKLVAIRVRTGVTDGKVTEIRGADLKVGMQVIAGITSAISTTTNPFQQAAPQSGPPRGF
ncbi:MAG: hypothetical protein ABI877_11175, partial [Gemmatimonadaceae bacterium]